MCKNCAMPAKIPKEILSCERFMCLICVEIYNSHYERLYLTIGTQLVTISLVSSPPIFITCQLLAMGMF